MFKMLIALIALFSISLSACLAGASFANGIVDYPTIGLNFSQNTLSTPTSGYNSLTINYLGATLEFPVNSFSQIGIGFQKGDIAGVDSTTISGSFKFELR